MTAQHDDHCHEHAGGRYHVHGNATCASIGGSEQLDEHGADYCHEHGGEHCAVETDTHHVAHAA